MKQDIIKQLYRENLKIIGSVYTDVSEHKVELKAATDAGRALEQTLSKSQLELFERHTTADAELRMILEEATFAEGFRTAVKFMTDVYFDEDNPQIKAWLSFFIQKAEEE